MNNEIIRVVDSGPLLSGAVPSTADEPRLRSGWYLVAAAGQARLQGLFGPFPSRAAARFIGTSAQSLGLMVPG